MSLETRGTEVLENSMKDPMPQYFRKENAAACSNPAFQLIHRTLRHGVHALLGHLPQGWGRPPTRRSQHLSLQVVLGFH